MASRITLFAALLSSALASACAAGDAIEQPSTASSGGGSDGTGGGRDGAGGAGDGGRTSSSGPTGSTSTTGSATSTTVSSTQSGTSASNASSSSTGSPCDEQPCKLLSPQCGCGVDEKCSLDGSGDRVCVDDGTRTQGQECGNGLGDCEAGALCVYVFDTDDAISACSRFCESDAQCEGQGGLCTLGLNGVSDVKLCSDNCDLVSGSGCAIAGTKCSYGVDDAPDPDRFFTICTGVSGAGVLFEPCTADVGCATGFECFNEQNSGDDLCFQWCSSAAPNCPNGLSCFTGFNPPLQIGNVTYGVCQG